MSNLMRCSAMVVWVALGALALSGDAVGWSGYTPHDMGDAQEAPGGVTVSEDGLFTVWGSGSNIWGNSDNGFIAFKTLRGDATFIARIVSMDFIGHDSSKVGLMIRESLNENARNAYVQRMPDLTNGSTKGLAFQNRRAPGATTVATQNSELGQGRPQWPLPVWIKLVREGDLFSGYGSQDGETWVQLTRHTGYPDYPDTVEIPMSREDVYIGFALQSHITGTEFSATLDNVTIIGDVSDPPTPEPTPTPAPTPPAPAFSHRGGFYTEPFDLVLTAEEADMVIRYTLDGSAPDETSPIYAGPIRIDACSDEPNRIAGIQSTPHFDPSRVDTDYVARLFLECITWIDPPVVEKARVIRAAAFRPGAEASDVITRTYWVGPDMDRRFQLPVVSLNTNAENLFDDYMGIYVPGADFRNSNPGRPWHSHPANYRYRGEAWERLAHLEWFGPDGALWMAQNAGVRIHGGASRSAAQKTLRLYARSDYGTSRFNYPLFENQPHNRYNRLLLRNSGNDWPLTMFRDALAHSVVLHMDVDGQDYRPMVVFINGEYWGIHNLRERLDKHYVARKYGVDPDNLDILDRGTNDNLSLTVNEGDRTHYTAMWNYVRYNDMSDPEHFAHVETLIDIDSFIDYFIAQMFTRNTDWPGNNISFWRARVPYTPNAPTGHDGRWRWFLFDLDFGYGYQGGANDYNHNMMNTARNHLLFRRLIDGSPEFRQRFLNRFTDQLNTAFQPERVLAMLEAMQAEIADEMAHQIERWQRPASLEQWHERVGIMRTFATHRANAVRGHLRSSLNLGPDRTLSLNVSDPSRGHVRINRTDINGQTPGVDPDAPYPWSGRYYSGQTVDLQAMAAPGYRFSHWDGPAGWLSIQSDSTKATLSSDMQLTANFEPLALLHYWHFNGLADNTITEVPADFTVLGDATITYPGPGDGYMDSVGGTDVNARLSQPAGQGLRVRNPSDTRQLLFTLPTTGYEGILFGYAVHRTTNGAPTQTIEYRVGLQDPWQSIGTITVPEDYEWFSFDFSAIPGVADNPDFAVRILFEGETTAGPDGNNRFDNVTLEGLPMEGTNQPPQVEAPIPFTQGIEQSALEIDLSPHFSDPENDLLTYSATVVPPFVAEASIEGDILTLTPQMRGDAIITIAAEDGHNVPVTTDFRLLVYPAAHSLGTGAYRFEAWAADEPERHYPAGMLFLQSDTADPGLETPLEHAYYVPHDGEDGYHEEDMGQVGYPYNLTRRSRINGLGDQGVAFINTGRERDLGGALVAVDTTGLSEPPLVQWLGGLVQNNDRRYVLRLQYRVGHTGPFADVLHNDQPVEYRPDAGTSDGNLKVIGPVELPADAQDQPYVQLLWRYYHAEGDLGPRDQLRLDNIFVGTMEEPPPLGRLILSEVMYAPLAGSDMEFLEFFNPSPLESLDLSGLVFDDGIFFAFPQGTEVAPEGYLLLVCDPSPGFEDFYAYYGLSAETPVVGPYTGRLSNSGERVTLIRPLQGEVILSFEYEVDRGWPIPAMGFGHSMVPIDTLYQPIDSLDYCGAWRASTYMHGSPGGSDPEPPLGVVLNEIMAHTDTHHAPHTSNDWIELYNRAPYAITLRDYYLSDKGDNLTRWAIPEITIPGHGRVSFDEIDDFNTPLGTGFALNKAGEDAFLSHLPGTDEDRIVDNVQFEGEESFYSLSRYPDGGPYWFHTPMTRDRENAPKAPDLVISEIMYNPPPRPGASEAYEGDKYVEIHNPTNREIFLVGEAGPWRLDGDIEFTLPLMAPVPAQGHVLVVSFPTTDTVALENFKAHYGLEASEVQIFGPFTGDLSNRRTRVSLERHQAPDGDQDTPSWVIVDEVIYFHQAPFPPSANGEGHSLQRIDPNGHGIDPSNWGADDPTPGAATVAPPPHAASGWLIY